MVRVAAKVARGPAFGNIHSEKGKQVDAVTLASRWVVDHKKALNTVRMTTRSCSERGQDLHVSLSDTEISNK